MGLVLKGSWESLGAHATLKTPRSPSWEPLPSVSHAQSITRASDGQLMFTFSFRGKGVPVHPTPHPRGGRLVPPRCVLVAAASHPTLAHARLGSTRKLFAPQWPRLFIMLDQVSAPWKVVATCPVTVCRSWVSWGQVGAFSEPRAKQPAWRGRHPLGKGGCSRFQSCSFSKGLGRKRRQPEMTMSPLYLTLLC